MIIHSLVGCNLRCFGCHNYDELIVKQHAYFYSEADVLKHIKKSGYIFDSIIFSGGEFLIHDVDIFKSFLIKVRDVFDGKIIINTNATQPNKVKILIESNLVDGFHVDMKLPYHLLHTDGDSEVFKTVLGIIPYPNIAEKMLETINLVVEHNSEYSQIRTVKYPVLSEEYFEEIKKYIQQLNNKYNSHAEWKLNEFHSVN